MTVKEFSEKYGISSIKVKAALNLGKSRKNGGAGSHAENHMDYSEDDMRLSVYAYLMEDMRACVDRAAEDNMLIKQLVKKSSE